ncbi:MAG: hypothetical protein K6G50_06015 [bacterium]|nr:hypothetical protein [bacterium]
MSPFEVWNSWTMRQIVIMHNLACRAVWNEHKFQAIIAGGEMKKEPDWYLGGKRPDPGKGRRRQFEELAALFPMSSK